MLQVRGDTVVEDRQYKKLYYREYFPTGLDERDARPPYAVGPERVVALLRDDTTRRAVYGRVSRQGGTSLSTDTLIHDYGASAGDTLRGAFWGEDTFTVDQLTVIDTFGASRRLQHSIAGSYLEGFGKWPEGGPLTYPQVVYTQEGHTFLLEYCVGTACNFDLISSFPTLPTITTAAYPNPATHRLSLEGLQELGGSVRVLLFRMGGSRQSSTTIPQGTVQTSLDVSAYPRGIYLLVLIGNRAKSVQRLLLR